MKESNTIAHVGLCNVISDDGQGIEKREKENRSKVATNLEENLRYKRADPRLKKVETKCEAERSQNRGEKTRPFRQQT
jgi:hypothetical protein